MNKLKLSDGQYALIDADLFDELSQYKWCVDQDGYPMRAGKRKKADKFINVKLHRVVNQTPEGMHTDHKNRNILDCRRSNLRTVSHAQNMMNCKPHRRSTSKYKGVGWHKKSACWRVRIQKEGQRVSVGYFQDEIIAAQAYNDAALKYHGEFAYVNEVPNG